MCDFILVNAYYRAPFSSCRAVFAQCLSHYRCWQRGPSR